MALPNYDKSKRKQSFQLLPKGAYVVKFMGAREDAWPRGGAVLRLPFDIAEGEYKGFYDKQFQAAKARSEDAKWPYDAVFSLSIPDDSSQEYVWQNWNNFFADLEDSNNGFVFDGDVKKIKGKIIGGKFRIRQSESKGKVYDHTDMAWTCVADDVRNGKAGRMPNDKMLGGNKKPADASAGNGTDMGWMDVSGDGEEDLPF